MYNPRDTGGHRLFVAVRRLACWPVWCRELRELRIRGWRGGRVLEGREGRAGREGGRGAAVVRRFAGMAVSVWRFAGLAVCQQKPPSASPVLSCGRSELSARLGSRRRGPPLRRRASKQVPAKAADLAARCARWRECAAARSAAYEAEGMPPGAQGRGWWSRERGTLSFAAVPRPAPPPAAHPPAMCDPAPPAGAAKQRPKRRPPLTPHPPPHTHTDRRHPRRPLAGGPARGGAGSGNSHAAAEAARALLTQASRMGPWSADTEARMYADAVCEATRKLKDGHGHAASTQQASGRLGGREGLPFLLFEALGPLATAMEALEAQHGGSVYGGVGTVPTVPWLQLPLDLWADGGQAEVSVEGEEVGLASGGPGPAVGQGSGSNSGQPGAASPPAQQEGGTGGVGPHPAAAAGRGGGERGARVLVAAAERVIRAVAACPAACSAGLMGAEDEPGMGLLVERLGQLIWHCLWHPGALTDEAAMHRHEVRLNASSATPVQLALSALGFLAQRRSLRPPCGLDRPQQCGATCWASMN